VLASCLSTLLSGCGNIKTQDQCQFSAEQIETIRSNSRDFLEAEMGGDFVYYDTDNSISSSVSEFGGRCAILFMPAGKAEDGSTLLHGEGAIYIDVGTLEPTDLAYFRW
jgi:hypothetical protein